MGIRHIPGEALTIGEYYRLQEEKEASKKRPTSSAISPDAKKPKKELTEAQKESRRKALEKWNKKRRDIAAEQRKKKNV